MLILDNKPTSRFALYYNILFVCVLRPNAHTKIIFLVFFMIFFSLFRGIWEECCHRKEGERVTFVFSCLINKLCYNIYS